MKGKKSVVGAIILSGAVGLVSGPAWSQEAPGETRQPNPNLTRPGRGENDIPGSHGTGTPELSKNDMQKVEEALRAKGYQVGKIDGVADDDARKAIRSFQQDSGMPITGMVDQRTADRLGVRLSAKGGRSQERSTSGMPGQGAAPRSQAGDDQNLPPSGTRR
jgi:peptidoglycan hydrolase-like protein with peptidoglycan-binding domain